jgi:hypothetical protein
MTKKKIEREPIINNSFDIFNIRRGKKKGTIQVLVKTQEWRSPFDPRDFSTRETLRIATPEEIEELIFKINKEIIKKGE